MKELELIATNPDSYREQRREEKNTIVNSDVEYIGKVIVNSAYRVHRELGPGLLEKVYEICLSHEITKSGIGTASNKYRFRTMA